MKATQPPSGGCVLKHGIPDLTIPTEPPAAFRRLCVETIVSLIYFSAHIASRLQAAVC